MSVFVLDTNVISDITRLVPDTNVVTNISNHHQDTICLCEAVDYEVRRGYLKTGATTRLQIYEQQIKPQFQWIHIIESDWRQAAQFWADTVVKGIQLSDLDLLVAAVAVRLGGSIISADHDFDYLSVSRHNWRSI
jgi:predicted nucleic acid-binding protein